MSPHPSVVRCGVLATTLWPPMSTRMLIVLTLLCGVAILAAFVVQLILAR